MKIKKYKSGEIGYWRITLTLAGLVLTQLITTGAIFYKTPDKIKKIAIYVGGDDDTEVVDNTQPKKKEPPKIIPQEIEVVKDDVKVDDPPDLSNDDDGKDVDPPAPPKKPGKPAPPPPDKIFIRVQKRAEFPGGMEAFRNFLSDNLVYPEDASDLGIQKNIMVNFIVRKDGSIDGIKVMNSKDDYGFYDEALRVVKLMASKYKYKPAVAGNKNVSSRFNLPIIFVPNDDDDDDF